MSVTPLTIVEPDDTHVEPLNICLYGPAGNGKTVAACSAPGPILVLNADRPGALRFARKQHQGKDIREVRYQDRGTLGQVANYLKSDEGADVQTVAVDPLGEIYAALAKQIGGRQPTQQQWGNVISDITDFVHFLSQRPVHVVLVCHEGIEDTDDGGATRRPLTGGKKLPEKVMGMMDVVGYCGVRYPDEGPPEYVAQLVQAQGRRAKDSTGALGEQPVLDIEAWIAKVEDEYNDASIPFNPPDADEETPAEDGQGDDATPELALEEAS